jgi:hypothetical protein
MWIILGLLLTLAVKKKCMYCLRNLKEKQLKRTERRWEDTIKVDIKRNMTRGYRLVKKTLIQPFLSLQHKFNLTYNFSVK